MAFQCLSENEVSHRDALEKGMWLSVAVLAYSQTGLESLIRYGHVAHVTGIK